MPYCDELVFMIVWGFVQGAGRGSTVTSLFSQGLSGMVECAFELKPSAEVKEEDVEISEADAISRLRPIQDGLDDWEEHGSSTVRGLGGPAPE
jgi:hypothetical protein